MAYSDHKDSNLKILLPKRSAAPPGSDLFCLFLKLIKFIKYKYNNREYPIRTDVIY